MKTRETGVREEEVEGNQEAPGEGGEEEVIGTARKIRHIARMGTRTRLTLQHEGGEEVEAEDEAGGEAGGKETTEGGEEVEEDEDREEV